MICLYLYVNYKFLYFQGVKKLDFKVGVKGGKVLVKKKEGGGGKVKKKVIC